MNSIIEVKCLTTAYSGQIILENISFYVDTGEILVIVGGSGCGKSTLLKNMIGLLPPLAGQIIIDGIEVTNAHNKNLRHLRRSMGVLFQSGALLASLTLLENVALPLMNFTSLSYPTILDVARVKLAMMGLAGYENHLPSEISGGMKKRAGLARAMALDPKVLFFDEPSAGLDPVTSAELDQLIIRINIGLGTTMVIISHDLNSIYTIAKRVLMLDKSTRGAIAYGNPHILRDTSKNPSVRNFFLRQTRD